MRPERAQVMPPGQLVSKLASVMQEYTQSGGVRPFGVSLLIAGWDTETDRPYLYQCDPSVCLFFSFVVNGTRKFISVILTSGSVHSSLRYAFKMPIDFHPQ